jgi:hypothetical protein
MLANTFSSVRNLQAVMMHRKGTASMSTSNKSNESQGCQQKRAIEMNLTFNMFMCY